jgi:hypothetical protein
MTAGRARLPVWRGWIACGVSYLLALHLLVAGFMSVAHAGPATQPSFASVLCSAAAGEHPDQGGHGGTHVPECCVVGCHSACDAALLTPAAALPLALAPTRYAASVPAAPGTGGAAVQSPHQARAPPERA